MSGRPFLKVLAGCAAIITVLFLPGQTENAVANGDTRTIQLYHAHTKESITATFLVNGSYDQAVLDKLNWFLRDWRRDEATKMDARLFDVIWEVYRESGSRQPVEVMSAYRSPETNAMLRRRSRAVAEHSQHILGKAMDQHYMDVPMSRIREIAMRLQRGGVGFYPTAGTPFVHMDVGGVRHWPRMSYDQLSRLFPDGKTVHIPSNGQPLPGYEQARAELEARGDDSYPTASALKSKGFFAWLFGSGGGDDEEDAAESGGRASSSRNQRVAMVDRHGAPAGPVANYDSFNKDGGAHSFFASQQATSTPPATPYGRVAHDTPAPQPAAPPPPPPPVMAEAVVEQPPANSAPPASAAPADATRAVAELSSPSQTIMSNGLTVPTPPRRPVELAGLGDDLPLPPVRPIELSRPTEAAAPTPNSARLAKADAIGALLNGRAAATPGLPPLITQGSGARAMPQVLAYAGTPIGTGRPGDVPLPVARPGDLVQARLDRSNFRSLTSVIRTDRTVTRAVLGSTVIGVRAASRGNAGVLAVNAPVVTRFGSKVSDLATDRFSGPAVKSTERLITARRAEAAAARSKED